MEIPAEATPADSTAEELVAKFEGLLARGTFHTPSYATGKDVPIERPAYRASYHLPAESAIAPLTGDLLRSRSVLVPGVSTPQAEVSEGYGTLLTRQPGEGSLALVSVLLAGSGRVWTSVSPRHQHKLQDALRRLCAAFQLPFSSSDEAIRHFAGYLSTAFFEAHQISYTHTLQRAGQAVLLYGPTYYQGFNLGANLAEAVNYGLPRTGLDMTMQFCNSHEGPAQSLARKGFQRGKAGCPPELGNILDPTVVEQLRPRSPVTGAAKVTSRPTAAAPRTPVPPSAADSAIPAAKAPRRQPSQLNPTHFDTTNAVLGPEGPINVIVSRPTTDPTMEIAPPHTSSAASLCSTLSSSGHSSFSNGSRAPCSSAPTSVVSSPSTDTPRAPAAVPDASGGEPCQGRIIEKAAATLVGARMAPVQESTKHAREAAALDGPPLKSSKGPPSPLSVGAEYKRAAALPQHNVTMRISPLAMVKLFLEHPTMRILPAHIDRSVEIIYRTLKPEDILPQLKSFLQMKLDQKALSPPGDHIAAAPAKPLARWFPLLRDIASDPKAMPSIITERVQAHGTAIRFHMLERRIATLAFGWAVAVKKDAKNHSHNLAAQERQRETLAIHQVMRDLYPDTPVPGAAPQTLAQVTLFDMRVKELREQFRNANLWQGIMEEIVQERTPSQQSWDFRFVVSESPIYEGLVLFALGRTRPEHEAELLSHMKKQLKVDEHGPFKRMLAYVRGDWFKCLAKLLQARLELKDYDLAIRENSSPLRLEGMEDIAIVEHCLAATSSAELAELLLPVKETIMK